MEDVAVVIPNKNYGRFLPEALDSVLAQTHRPQEVVIVDDGSDDGSVNVVRSWLSDHGNPSGWRVIESTGSGLLQALSLGLATTSAPFVTRLDADDVLHPEFLAKLVDALSTHTSAGYAYPAMMMIGEDTGRYPVHPFDPARLVMEGNFVSACALFRRGAYEQTRGLADLPAWEDWDLWLSFLEAGWSGVFVDEELYFWRRHGPSRNKLGLAKRRLLRLRIMGRHPGLVVKYWWTGLPHAVQRARRPLERQ